MGTQQSKQVKATSQWEWSETDNGVEIYRNKQDGRVAERRRVILTGTYALSEQRKVYNFRSTNPYGLVKSYEVVQIQDPSKQKDKISDLCRCGNERIQLDVFTQRIQYRLSQLPQLTFAESLLILKQTIIAFEIAYQKVGGLHINPELIGITEKGEVRAWVNQNWALNRPSHIIPILKSSSSKEYINAAMPEFKDQSQMVSNLVSVVSQKTEKGHLPQPFAEQLRAKSANFRSIKRFLNEYVSVNNITLPTVINKNKLAMNNNTKIGSQIINQSNLANQNTNQSNYINSSAVNALPSHPVEQTFPTSKFSFVNTLSKPNNVNSSISFKQESTYKPFQFKPFPKFSSSYNPAPSSSMINLPSQIPQSQSLQIKQVLSSYKPYFSEAKNQGQPYKPILNQLKFNLLQKFQHETRPINAKFQPMNSNIISRPESPHYTLNQFNQNEGQTTHNASYKILQSKQSDVHA